MYIKGRGRRGFIEERGKSDNIITDTAASTKVKATKSK